MAHKVHPKVFRLKNVGDWESRWLNTKKFPQYLEEDFIIRSFLEKKLKDCGIQNIEIERFPGRVNIIINTARPGFVIGRGGKGAEDLKKEIEKHLKPSRDGKRELKIDIREIKNLWLSAMLVGQWVAQQLEKRTPFRRTIKQALEKIMANKEAQGARIEVAGRLGGSEIARREWLKRGRLPRHTIRAIIDYAHTEALCTYGKIGIKVWIYKGEQFD